jgi:hypothetical protein
MACRERTEPVEGQPKLNTVNPEERTKKTLGNGAYQIGVLDDCDFFHPRISRIGLSFLCLRIMQMAQIFLEFIHRTY